MNIGFMKLLYITNGINGAGGLERVLSIKASYLTDVLGYDVTILCLNDNHLNPFYDFSDKIKFCSIPVLGNAIQYIFKYKRGVQKIIEQVKPDVISVCDDGTKAFFLPYLIGKKCPLIYERHASVKLNFSEMTVSRVKQLKNKCIHYLFRILASKFNAFVVLTNGNKSEWRPDNVIVIPNPLSFYPKEKSLLENNSVIAVGSHSYNKGYDLLLDAWKLVIQNHEKWKLHIYGKFDKQKTFLNYASKLEIDNSVSFYKPTTDIQERYLNSSIMVLPSRSEGFGMVLIEAMACGVPCIAFNCPHGPADIIIDNEDGLIVPNGDIEAFSEAIIKLIKNEGLRRKMGDHAKENVKRYLPEAVMPQWDTLFKTLVK